MCYFFTEKSHFYKTVQKLTSFPLQSMFYNNYNTFKNYIMHSWHVILYLWWCHRSLYTKALSISEDFFFNLIGSGLQVGKGLSKDENARELAVQHWLEAVSPYRFPSLTIPMTDILSFQYIILKKTEGKKLVCTMGIMFSSILLYHPRVQHFRSKNYHKAEILAKRFTTVLTEM